MELAWDAAARVVGVDLVLSGDNALVIAMAARHLPDRSRRLAIAWGTGAAIALRILLAGSVATLLGLPGVRLVAALLLIGIAVRLVRSETDAPVAPGAGKADILGAISVILVADLTMSIDNVVATAAAAGDRPLVLAVGIAFSVVLLMVGGYVLAELLERSRFLVLTGGLMLGWIAGELAISDPVLAAGANGDGFLLPLAVPFVCAALVLIETYDSAAAVPALPRPRLRPAPTPAAIRRPDPAPTPAADPRAADDRQARGFGSVWRTAIIVAGIAVFVYCVTAIWHALALINRSL